MSTPNRFNIVGDWKFVGEGKVFDTNKGKEFKAKLEFKSQSPAIETNPDDRKDVKTTLKLIEEEHGGMWEMVIYDNEEAQSE